MEPSNEKEILEAIMAKAWKEETFKQELIANPLKAIGDLLGHEIKLSDGRKIVVTDQSDPKTIYINIPVNEDELDVELSEDELDQASGGNNVEDYLKWLAKGGS